MGTDSVKKDRYFIDLCLSVAKGSSCSQRKVGAVIVKNGSIVSTGYNGTPKGCLNCDLGGCPRGRYPKVSGKDLEDALCCHAEENAIVQAASLGSAIKDSTLYTSLKPCHLCSKMIINAGIKEVVWLEDYPNHLGIEIMTKSTLVNVRRFKDADNT